jgi:hypothetical protein
MIKSSNVQISVNTRRISCVGVLVLCLLKCVMNIANTNCIKNKFDEIDYIQQ